MSQLTDEEILMAAQGDALDEVENFNARKGLRIGMAVAVIAIIVMFLVEYIIFKKLDFGKPVILGLMATIADLTDGIINRRKKYIVKGIVEAVFTLFLLILYIGELIA